jgi:hypothetical protein
MNRREFWREFRRQAKKSWTLFATYIGVVGAVLESQLHFLDNVPEQYRALVWGGVIALIGFARLRSISASAKEVVAAEKSKEGDI